MKFLKSIIFFLFFFNSFVNAEEKKKINPSYTAGYMSNYIVNGVEENGGKGTPYFNIFIPLPKNIYFGAWTAEVDPSLYGGADHEIDYYLGYSDKFQNLIYDFGHTTYYYLGSSNEGQTFGEYTAKFNLSLSNFLTFGYDFAKTDQGDKTETINYYVNYRILKTNIKYNIGESENYSNFQTLSFGKTLSGVNIELTYIDTAMKTPDPNKDKDFLTLNISKTF